MVSARLSMRSSRERSGPGCPWMSPMIPISVTRSPWQALCSEFVLIAREDEDTEARSRRISEPFGDDQVP